MSPVLGRKPLESMRLAHPYDDGKMVRSGCAEWGIRRKAEYGIVPREGRAVATMLYDLCRTYGYDVCANRARAANAKE